MTGEITKYPNHAITFIQFFFKWETGAMHLIIIIIFLMSELNNALNGLITCYKKKTHLCSNSAECNAALLRRAN